MSGTKETDLDRIQAELANPFDPDEVKFKPQMVKNNRCLALAYIDARVVEDRLDDVMGVENWADSYAVLADGSVSCRLSLKLAGEWVTKEDVGSPSDQPDGGDRLKAAYSDALKRAAVKFGIGRYIYRIQAGWVDYDPVKKQIVSPPILPKWALPVRQVRREDAKPATAAKQDAKILNTKTADDLEIERWYAMFQAAPELDEVNQSLIKLKTMGDNVKRACWDRVKAYASSRGWEFNDQSMKFAATQKARAN